jgi:hypothetical protein
MRHVFDGDSHFMKNFSLVYLIVVFLGASSIASAQSVPKCFRADWLQGGRVVNLTIKGSKVSGTFSVGGGEPITADRIYEFSGTLNGKALTVVFAGNRLPDVAPSEMKSLVWTLVKFGSKEILRIKFSGKSYTTNNYEVHSVDFEPCEEDYAVLTTTAKRVRFARGADSAVFPVSFRTTHERRSFLLKVKAGQRIAVEAPGCGISFYYPDRRPYEEGTEIDTWSSDSVTQAGDYLFVIKPVLEPGKCSATFRVTN